MPKLLHKPGKYYLKAAVNQGNCTSRPANGDHVLVIPPPQYKSVKPMTMPMHRELANGTECAILKWLLMIGVTLPAIVCAISCWLMGQV